MKKNLDLSAPWYIFYSEVNELFKDDPEVKVVYNEEANEIKLYVDNEEKAEALTELLPTEKIFGKVVVRLTVVPANMEENKVSMADLFNKAFKGNPAFVNVVSTEGVPGAFQATYVVFAKKVVQYYADNLADPNGLTSTLYQEIARNVFGDIDVNFCTNNK